ncbi:MAG: hypothetical protein H3C30_13475 [Candidatus Hydrogenedentes bacterium]|nr:hypothetical protein [Candidatus Hydrogenedentota bacterium]
MKRQALDHPKMERLARRLKIDGCHAAGVIQGGGRMRAGECRPPGSEPAATPAGRNPTKAAKNRACQDDTGTARRSQGNVSGNWKVPPVYPAAVPAGEGPETALARFISEDLTGAPECLLAELRSAAKKHPDRVNMVFPHLLAVRAFLRGPGAAAANVALMGMGLANCNKLGGTVAVLRTILKLKGLPRAATPGSAAVVGWMVLDLLTRSPSGAACPHDECGQNDGDSGGCGDGVQ